MKRLLFLALPLLLATCTPSGPGSSRSSHSAPEGVNVSLMIPAGQYGRHQMRPMDPRYITVHTTQSYGRGAGARTHAQILRRGGLKSTHNSLGYLTWHFSVDSESIYQSLPTNEQGQHADYEGSGNKYSIGIEMCENRDGSFAATKARTAKLIAQLMKQHDIPLSRVVGHCEWERVRYSDGKNLGYKNCPKPLLDNGKYGPKWQAFKRQIQSYL
ncbi:N-acetylmuramoyl-L-alanine amidase family protein [Roseibacillus ishigakijimensis]|uniref:N-acetylmuramoyl-L-alanine amidase n=1 Tax=Roseibacillus ishigakijimensis TaxID=454146 RepID=A0A934VGJ1_9BACT|nr:N-acetylmuramoyl-L-alanine amidase [Roseibacillus ishigakijimensis]MBK1832923.1 N-acetylmuramoyl-L-alanine amidase [Roseibacillus ishigakijimensis]